MAGTSSSGQSRRDAGGVVRDAADRGDTAWGSAEDGELSVKNREVDLWDFTGHTISAWRPLFRVSRDPSRVWFLVRGAPSVEHLDRYLSDYDGAWFDRLMDSEPP